MTDRDIAKLVPFVDVTDARKASAKTPRGNISLELFSPGGLPVTGANQ
jgi:hypothetical protein